MRHLIIIAHPAERSLTALLANAYVAKLGDLGHERGIHDLYRMGFNPILPPRASCNRSTPITHQRLTLHRRRMISVQQMFSLSSIRSGGCPCPQS
jgi:putative NADPH-quinone reductase